MPLFIGLTLPYGEEEFSGNSLYYRELIGEWEWALPSIKKSSLGTHNILGIPLVHWSYSFLYWRSRARTCYILRNILVRGSYVSFYIKRVLISHSGMTSLMGLTLPYEEGKFSGNLLYYRKLIGEWEIALPTVKKCSFATHDILGFALV